MVAFPEGTTELQMSLKSFSHEVLQMWYEVSINPSVKISFKTRYQNFKELKFKFISNHFLRKQILWLIFMPNHNLLNYSNQFEII